MSPVLTPDIGSPTHVAGEEELAREVSIGCLGLFQEGLSLLHPRSPAGALQLAGFSNANMAKAWLRPGYLTITLTGKVLRNIFLHRKEATISLFSLIPLTELCYKLSYFDSFTSKTNDLSREYWDRCLLSYSGLSRKQRLSAANSMGTGAVNTAWPCPLLGFPCAVWEGDVQLHL